MLLLTRSDAATSVSYAMVALVSAFGGPICARLGIRWMLIIGAATFPVNGSAYYVSNVYRVDWYLILGRALYGIGRSNRRDFLSGLYSFSSDRQVLDCGMLPKQRLSSVIPKRTGEEGESQSYQFASVLTSRYLAIWVGSRNMGSLVGGFISLGRK
jgi:MFS family permease